MMTDNPPGYRVKVDNGKYEIIYAPGVKFVALRYGEEWRDLNGDSMVLAMMYRIEELENEVAAYVEKMKEGKT